MKRLRRLSIDHLYIIVALGGAFVAAYGLFGVLNNPPALEYTQRYYQAARAVYAPGERIVYTPTLRYRDWGPVDVRRTFNVRPSGVHARLCDGSDAPVRDIPRNLVFESVGVYREPNTSELVPKLPPGDYWLTNSAKGERKSQYQVPFSVVEPC